MLSSARLLTRRSGAAGRLGYYVLCSALAVVFLFPVVWVLISVVKPPAEAAAVPPTFLPSRISLDNFAALSGVGGVGIGQYIFNSGVVALGTVVGTVILSTLAGYGFSRFTFPGKNVVFVAILITLMIPFQSILTPLFFLLHKIDLQNSLTGLCLVYITFQLPFSVFMMRNSFDTVPRELEEAAFLDGCSAVGVLPQVMLPIVTPAIVTVGLFAFFASWNEFLAALIFMTDQSKYTLPVMLTIMQAGQMGTLNWGLLQAGVFVTMAPCVILFLALQRYYVSGLAAGAVKA